MNKLARSARRTHLLAADLSAIPDGDAKIGPPYTDALELTVKPGVPRGKLNEFTMDSTDSKIYPGVNGPYKRQVAVYVPEGYVVETPAPLLVVQDGMSFKDALRPILDNMIHDLRVPPVIAVFLDSGGGDGKGSQRSLEYDAVSDDYAVFVETEVLPRVAREYRLTITKDPRGRATMGGGSGGACAFTMAWRRPDLFRRVLSYSGAYVDPQSAPDPKTPHGAWDYHEHLIVMNDVKPIRVWLEAGEKDTGFDQDEKSRRNAMLANERMAAALKDKKYHYRYLFAAGAGPVDRKVVSQTLPDALQWVWQGYPTD
ncbi:MAG TPA: alpha/beta hydrolase-fold protein [Gemmataceae bacterium]|nr:alpha/beta hydrolase-fold protein [Gemmataceae bacterium]